MLAIAVLLSLVLTLVLGVSVASAAGPDSIFINVGEKPQFNKIPGEGPPPVILIQHPRHGLFYPRG